MTEPTPQLQPLAYDPIFNTAKNIPELRAWLVRAYFNPQKHKDMSYFSDTVTKDNVLEYITAKQKVFPQSPHSIVSVWNILPDLRQALRTIPDNNSAVKEKKEINLRAETSLREISISLGGLTTTMVDKIADQAVVKFSDLLKKLTSKNNYVAMEAMEKITNARLTVAEAYADLIFTCSTPEEIFFGLVKRGLLQKRDSEIMDTIEKECLSELIVWTQDENMCQSDIEDIILEDLDKSVNLFRSAQQAVSRIMFPSGNPGRPAKHVSQ